MKFLAVIAGALTMVLGHAGTAHDVSSLPTPPQARVTQTVHVPTARHWVQCPGNPRILMACFRG